MHKLYAITVFIVIGLLPVVSLAYTEEEFYTQPHPKPLYFIEDGSGGFYGVTENNITFTQTPVINNQGIRLHKFSIGEVIFYVSDKGIIQARSDLIAVSKYFSLV